MIATRHQQILSVMQKEIPQDHVDHIIHQWIDLGFTKQKLMAMETIGRLKRIENKLMKQLEKNYQNFDLLFWEFDVLATLKRSNLEHCLSPTALFKDMMVTSGTMTHRLQQLEKRKLIERIADPNDKRSLMVKLTSCGKEIIDQCIPTHIHLENQLVSQLEQQEIEHLNYLLKKLEHSLP